MFKKKPIKRVLLHNSYELPGDRWNLSSHKKTITVSRYDHSQPYGLYTYFAGAKYPINGIPLEPAVYAVCVIKKMVINSLRFVKKFPYIAILFLISPIKKFLWTMFLSIANISLYPYLLEPNRYCPSGRELYRAGMKVLPQNQNLVELLCMMWEFDDAYRYRGQDILCLYQRENKLKQELKKMVKAYKQRELEPAVKNKIKYLLTAIKIMSLFPKIKRKVKAVLDEIDVQKIGLDLYDKYYAYQFMGYDFDGLSREERMKMRENL